MIRIEYQTQRLSLRFFMVMLVLFLLQTGLGLMLAAQHIDPTLLSGVFNFNVVRAEHTNLGILWILSGFIARSCSSARCSQSVSWPHPG